MEKLSKAARKIDILAQALFGISAVFGAAALIMSVMVNFVGGDFLSESSTTLTLGNVDFTLAENALPAPSSVKTHFITGMLVYALSAVYVCVVISVIRRILKPMIARKPFDSAVSKNIRALAWISLAAGFVYQAAELIGEAVLFKTYDIGSLFLGEKITGYQIDYTFDATFAIFFAVLYLLSMVFKYGEELQRQSDETL